MAVRFSPDGKRIVSSSLDHTIRQWDVDAGIQTGPLLRTGDAPVGSSSSSTIFNETVGAGYIADGRQIIGVGIRTIRAWDGASGRLLGERASPPPGTVGVSYSEVGHKYATLAGTNSESGTLASLKGTDIQVRNEAMQPIGSPLHHDKPVSDLRHEP